MREDNSSALKSQHVNADKNAKTTTTKTATTSTATAIRPKEFKGSRVIGDLAHLGRMLEYSAARVPIYIHVL